MTQVEAIIAQQIVDSTADSRTIIVGAGMVWDNTAKRLGINAASPAGSLAVHSPAANQSSLIASGYLLTGSNAQSLVDLAGTWNTTGQPTAIKLNITNTASARNSSLMDLQVGGVSRFRFDHAFDNVSLGPAFIFGLGVIQTAASGHVALGTTGAAGMVGISNGLGLAVGTGYYLGFGSTGNAVRDQNSAWADVRMYRESVGPAVRLQANGGLRIRNLTNTADGPLHAASAQLSADAATTKGLVVKGATAQTANLQEWQDSGGTALGHVSSTGVLHLNAGGSYSSGKLTFGGTVPQIVGGSSGLNITQASGIGLTLATSGGGLYPTQSFSGAFYDNQSNLGRADSRFKDGFFGGTVAGGALRATAPLATTTTLILKGAASQNANLQEWQNAVGTVLASVNSAGAFGTFGGFADGVNIALGTSTGSRIGTATDQKIGFWNATPVAQPTTGIAQATFLANAGGTAVNVDSTFDGYTLGQVVKAMRNLGLLA